MVELVKEQTSKGSIRGCSTGDVHAVELLLVRYQPSKHSGMHFVCCSIPAELVIRLLHSTFFHGWMSRNTRMMESRSMLGRETKQCC